jgi:hypothetical protein
MTSQAQDKLAVRFIGRKAPFFDRLYGTKLTFEKDQVRSVPVAIAKQFLKHGDCFELADAEVEVVKEADQLEDDTDAILEKAEQEKQDDKEEDNRIEDLRAIVLSMNDKQALANLSMEKWQQPLNKTKSVANLQQQVLQYIDQFGVV